VLWELVVGILTTVFVAPLTDTNCWPLGYQLFWVAESSGHPM